MLLPRRGIIQFLLLLASICLCLFRSAAVSAVDLSISLTITGSSTQSQAVHSGGGVVTPTGNVELSGLAFPFAGLTFLRDGVVIGTDIAASDGTFKRVFVTGSGVATFGVWARDKFGLISPTASVAFEVKDGSVSRVSGIALPPTIAHKSIGGDGSLEIYGSAFPGSVIRVFNNITPFTPPLTASVGADGVWHYTIPRGGFNVRSFSYKANYQYERLGIISPFSDNLELRLATCMNSDFNHDGYVNLTDLSILLYYWGRSVPKTGLTNECVDRNQDQIVDLRDFSILMYEWTVKYQLNNN